ncbi:MAG TPA: hypothetical protein VF316_13365 [Polyangiaceae bacterium]
MTNGRTDEGADGEARVVRGTGTFELKLEILAAGYPHVSFYPDRRSEGFAGT